MLRQVQHGSLSQRRQALRRGWHSEGVKAVDKWQTDLMDCDLGTKRRAGEKLLDRKVYKNYWLMQAMSDLPIPQTRVEYPGSVRFEWLCIEPCGGSNPPCCQSELGTRIKRRTDTRASTKSSGYSHTLVTNRIHSNFPTHKFAVHVIWTRWFLNFQIPAFDVSFDFSCFVAFDSTWWRTAWNLLTRWHALIISSSGETSLPRWLIAVDSLVHWTHAWPCPLKLLVYQGSY